MKKSCWPALLALSGALALTGAQAAAPTKEQAKKSAKATTKAPAAKTSSDQITSVPPPSGNWESKPPPAEGYVWSQGYYAWRDGRYQWKKGDWVLAQAGKDYRQHQWVQRGDKWHLVGGDWVADADRVAGNGK